VDAVVDEQYRYHVQFTMACIPFVTACGVDLLEGPPGAGVDPIRRAVFWTPSASDVNKTARFSIATKPDPCGKRALQSWSVFIPPDPPDTSGPVVSLTDPSAGIPGVPLNWVIQAKFNEDVDAATVTSTSFVLVVASTGAAVNGSVSYANRWAAFTPAAHLSGLTNYTATITTAVTDLAGNPMAAPHSWTFTTSAAPDTTGPVVVSRSPDNGSKCAPVDGLISATFDEDVRTDSGVFTFRDSASSPVNTQPLWNSSSPQRKLVFGPLPILAHSAQYTFTLSGAALRDLAGNQMAGDHSWTFTTVPAGLGAGTWSRFSTAESPPSMNVHTALWTGSELLVWGAFSSSMVGGLYNPATDSWRAIETAGSPSARNYWASVWAGTEFIVWGGDIGTSSTQFRNDGGRYNPATNTWRPVSTVGAPAGARLSTAVWTGKEMIVFGGSNSSGINTHNGRYNPATDSWLPVSTAGAPNVELFHSAIWTGTRMIVWGGSQSFSCTEFSGCSGTGAAYDPTTDTWSPISSVGAPSARSGHTALWTGSKMIIWGGSTPGGDTNTGAMYDPQTDAWQTISTGCGAPSERAAHQALWTGSEMIVWSGGNVRPTLSGARYDPATDSWQPISLSNAPATTSYETMVWARDRALVWRAENLPAGYSFQP
jgi:hypothetical protein